MKIYPAAPAAGLIALVLTCSLVEARTTSDLVTPEKRRATVLAAQRLTRPAEPEPVPATLAQPFNPPGFDQPDPEEARAAAAAAIANAAKSGQNPADGVGGGADQPAQQHGDREILENLAAKLVPKGTITRPGTHEPLLVIGKDNFEVGVHFTVTFNNQDYELELVSIESTTFTLRYKSVEITRPIKAGKSQ